MKIAMKCSQDQFDSVKDKLVGCELVGIGNFVIYDYLINYRFGNKNHITNYTWSAVRGDEAEIKDEWNEQVFLDACGIKKIFKAGELQFMDGGRWFDTIGEYRIKPDYSKEIAELERQIEILKNK